MKLEQFYTNDGFGQINRISGSVTDSEFIAAYKARFSDLDKFKKLRYIVSDLSDVTHFDVSTETVINISDIANKYAAYNKKLFIAGIHKQNIVYGMGRMWQAYSDDDKTGWVTKSFRTRHDAIIWLKALLSDLEIGW